MSEDTNTPPPAAPTPPPVAPAPAPAPAPVSSGSSNMTLAAIGYLIWILSLVAMLVEKVDPKVKFHAWNGLFWGIAQMIVAIAVRVIAAVLRHAPGGNLLAGVLGLLPLVMFVFSIIFLIQALKGQDVKIPIISDMARKQAGV